PDIFAVFIAYNPKNNKTYVADIRSGVDTKIWALDLGLPADINCPAVINTTPDYTYSYISNNFEFDNNGDLWSFSNYDLSTGICNMDKFDVTNGSVINSRPVQFPAGNFPTSITSGDLTILPNGRMFATLGSSPSRLYEITNYSSTSTNAIATFLTALPLNCYGIAYLNGQLEITGSDFSGNCYYFDYNISANVLGTEKVFQAGQLPIDNTSITPSLGVTMQLLNATKINQNTADLTFEIFVKSLGNVSLNDINVSNDLASVFGAANISNINVSFVPGANAAGLVLNAGFNGSNNMSLLAANQNLVNQTSSNTDYFFKLRVGLRVTNLVLKQYLSSALGSATIGSQANLSLINISDSSNNGPETVVDPNYNGNAGEAGENIPTPFDFATLPVKFIGINASLIDNNTSSLRWTVATPTINTDKFIIEYSPDARTWNSAGVINIVNANQGSYKFVHNNIPSGDLYYRVKETDIDGAYVYSNIVLLYHRNSFGSFVIFPNPANNYISISAPNNIAGNTLLTLYDALGKKLFSKMMAGAADELNTSALPDGTYVLKIGNNNISVTRKVLVRHEK
ncbi:MAG: T9SS type A sorting domain-containing protein, partial [Ginsengibacter sp.]